MATNRGITYPLALENGGLKVSSDYDLLRESIYSVLETRPGERIMRPTYGTPDLVFQAIANIAVVAEQVRISLDNQIPQVDFEVVGTVDEGGAITLMVNWTVGALPQTPIYYRLLV